MNTIHGCLSEEHDLWTRTLNNKYSEKHLEELKKLINGSMPLEKSNREYLVELNERGERIKSGIYSQEIDISYGKLLNNEEVLIVGPCESEINESKKNYTVIVHLNKPSIRHLNRYTMGKHILYLNGMYIDALEQKRLYNIDEIKRFDFISLKRPSKILEEQNLPIRQFPNIATLRYGSATILVGAIYDLLYYKFKSLTISGFTLYANGFQYTKSYKDFKDKDKDKSSLIDTFEDHDPLSNFSFIKLLWSKKIIDCDKRLSTILQMKQRDYLSSVIKSI